MYEVIEKRPACAHEVVNILKQRKELSYEQKLALEHAKLLDKGKKSLELIEELKQLGMRKLKEEFIVAIADMMPHSIAELKAILASSPVAFKQEELEQIMQVVEKHRK